MQSQITDTILMVRPSSFGFNEQTSDTNYFQKRIRGKISKKAVLEFDSAVRTLRNSGINVIVFEDKKDKATPDSVFPNNWVSFHSDGTVVLYPMYAENRRLERRLDIITSLRDMGFKIRKIVDLSKFEEQKRFLEGTGSMVFDNTNRVIYSALSPRTTSSLVDLFSQRFGYKNIKFRAYDFKGNLIYHTNVMLSIGQNFAIICASAIKNSKERLKVLNSLEKTGHKIIDVSMKQLKEFSCNSIEVKNNKGDTFLLMSDRAFCSLSKIQLKEIERFCSILHPSINTIEMVGGGSLRCMVSEIFLQKKT